MKTIAVTTRLLFLLAFLNGTGLAAPEGGSPDKDDVSSNGQVDADANVNSSADDQASMDELYAVLVKERSSLRLYLNRLRYAVNNNSNLKPETARTAVIHISKGYYMLKHPPLRAAFSTLPEIRTELERVRRMRGLLDTLELTPGQEDR